MDICYATVDPTICDAAGDVCDDGVLRFYQDEVGIGGRNLYDSKRYLAREKYAFSFRQSPHPATSRVSVMPSRKWL